jgi:hypothetical protein
MNNSVVAFEFLCDLCVSAVNKPGYTLPARLAHTVSNSPGSTGLATWI